jgi:capsular polysaccharide export protein
VAASRAVARIPGLGPLLDALVVRRVPAADPGAARAVLAWGRKPSAVTAQALATRLGLPLVRLEDGFLRSLGMAPDDPPLSLVVDDLGIYYDASAPSRLESHIAAAHSDEQRSRASRLVTAWRSGRVSKYNHARELSWGEKGSAAHSSDCTLFAGEGIPAPYVLVADQTRGDASIRHGRADAASFQRMLQAALEENPDSTVLLKVHPEVLAGRKQGHFDLPAVARNRRVRVLGQDVHPAGLIEYAQAVYVVSSQIGFEGLLWGKQVRTFGMPFYAGWGLTRDELPGPERRKPVPFGDLVHAALVEYPRYLDPETGRRCEAERVIEWMALQRRMRERFPLQVYAQGFSPWKKPIVRSFFQGSEVTFVRDAARIPANATAVVWGRAGEDRLRRSALADGRGMSIVRLEDGFLRSVGLGTDLVRPLSWIADRRGIYYDATGPSDLEQILQTKVFTAADRERAKALRDRIVALGMTKYNVGMATWQRHDAGRRVVLVPGQVERDASIRYGAPDVSTNMGLLRAVRGANPGAHVIYKPHPDVVAGLRSRGAGEADAGSWCDEIVTDVAMGALLDVVDDVHVLTSLAGFEALLRNKRVVTYGQPFYAGWGLTHDMTPVSRRTRRLSLDELTAGVLIEYPLYVSRATKRFTSPERTLDELLEWRGRSSASLPWWRKVLRLALRSGDWLR